MHPGKQTVIILFLPRIHGDHSFRDRFESFSRTDPIDFVPLPESPSQSIAERFVPVEERQCDGPVGVGPGLERRGHPTAFQEEGFADVLWRRLALLPFHLDSGSRLR